MSFLPIVARELRTTARETATYRVRTWVALLTSLIAALLTMIGGNTGGKQVGQSVFPALSALALAYCLLAGVRFAADCLSEEKREGTLGLLFLTDLKGYDVVLGKLVAVSMRTFQGLLAFFPVLSVTLLLGGITGGEFWRALAVLTNALFFALAVSLFASALTRQAHAAVAFALSLVLLLTCGPLLANGLLSNRFAQLGRMVGWASPITAGLAAHDMSYRLDPGHFWQALLLNHVLGWICLLFASWSLPHAWQDRVSGTVTELAPRRASDEATDPRRRRRTALRQRLLDINPIYWLAARHEGHRLLLWGIIGVFGTAAATAILFNYWTSGFTVALASGVGLALHLVLKLWVAWHACSILGEARRSGAVELLLATPLRVEEIIRGHWQALFRFFFWPVVVTLVIDLLPAFEALVRQRGQNLALLVFPLPAVTLYGMATFVLDLLALGWTGMWMGLNQPRTIQGFGRTIGLAMIVPALVFCFPNILFDLFWISWSRRKLEHDFRNAAANRYLPANLALLPSPAAKPLAQPPIIR